jgi:cytosine deaminase
LEVLVAGDVITSASEALPAARPRGRARRLDLGGYCLLPGAAEPHAHVDKAFLAPLVHNQPGGLLGALDAQRSIMSSLPVEEIAARARRALHLAISHGFTALRTHVSVGGGAGQKGLLALTSLRAELAGVVDLQLAVMVSDPVTGRGGRTGRRFLAEALDLGADIVGGAPWLAADPVRSVHELTVAAATGGHAIDLHLDETTDASVCTLGHYADRVEHFGLQGRAVASHCVSLGQLPLRRARSVARRLATAGIAVVVLPQTNLVLQGRAQLTRTPRGLPPLRLLEQCGVLVAAGGDNWRDPFNPLGRADPMETAALAAAAGHVPLPVAYEMVSQRARAVMGLAPAALKVGDRADMLAIAASDVAEAVAGASEQRAVLHAGQVVSWTELRQHAGLATLIRE